MHMKSVSVQNIAQISQAGVEFADLTILVGPQATGKSIFLQLVKLILDHQAVAETLTAYNIAWNHGLKAFLDIYFGEGMSGIYSPKSRVTLNGRDCILKKFAEAKGAKSGTESMFYIPAQRVLALRDGITRPFSDYRTGDPYVLRDFSGKLHHLIQSDFSNDTHLFPHHKRIKNPLKEKLAKHIFAGRLLDSVSSQHQKRMMLVAPGTKKAAGLPYLVWSAGQREFIPLLMGLYWLIPAGAIKKQPNIDWVVIEEPEMGLHPQGVETVMLLVMELLTRGYKVILSTHSPHVLDVVWAVRAIRNSRKARRLFLELFELAGNSQTNPIAETAVKAEYKVHYFGQDGKVRDISSLDPGAEDSLVRDWGGLTGFSSRASEVVGKAMLP